MNIKPSMKKRPYGPNGAEIDIDMDLARDVFLHFDMHFHKLSDFNRGHIQCILEGQKPLTTTSSPNNFSCILQKHFGGNLIERVHYMCKRTHTLEPAIAVGAFVWALNQSWANSIRIPDFLEAWGKTFLKPRFSTGQMREGAFFLEHLVSLIEKIPKQYKKIVLTSTLECLKKYATPWTVHGVNPLLCAHYLCLMGCVTAQCLSIVDSSWAADAASTLKGEGNAVQKLIVKTLIDGKMPPQWVYSAITAARPTVWCSPNVHTYVLPILNTQEELRIEQLSESSSTGDGPARREMVQLYCPNVFQLLDLATAADDWEFPERLLCIVSGWKNQTQMTGLEIPQNIMEFP